MSLLTKFPPSVLSLRDQNVLNKLSNAHSARRRLTLESPPSFLNQHRRFGKVDSENTDRTTMEQKIEEDMQRTCDAAFLSCLQDTQCTLCFTSLQEEGIDWASVTPETPCDDVTKLLFAGGHCTSLQSDHAGMDIFCNTFNSCIVWDDDDWSGGGGENGANSTGVDCSTLTQCDWPGFHRSFLGDGVCHDALEGCYNTEVCGFDGGDCCEDTCDHGNAAYTQCGMDGYACKDPSSANCNTRLSKDCPGHEDDDDAYRPGGFDCSANQIPYRLIMYDSFGDGWDDTKLTLTKKDDATNVIFTGGLKDGAEGIEHVCLDIDPTCYHIEVKGGVWGNEVSWEVKPFSSGTRAVADGGSPMSCEFSVAGDVCERTCAGKPNIDVNDDPDYKTYKEMYNCMLKTCVIQVGLCQDDPACAPCFNQDAPEYCFANDKFSAVIDCGICSCSGEEGEEMTEFCQQKATPGNNIPPPKVPDANKPRPCSAAETLDGSTAVMTFSKCSNFDQVGMMITDFDENNFGALDTFEACAHSYNNEHLHGGKTALGCMQILTNAITNPVPEDSDAPADAISALAGLLYRNAEEFCECASKSSAQCPLCPSFVRFKTLLYETLDACKALDEIDCDAWNEFYTPCKNNLVQMFGSVDFTDSSQCTFVAMFMLLILFVLAMNLLCSVSFLTQAISFTTHAVALAHSQPSASSTATGRSPSQLGTFTICTRALAQRMLLRRLRPRPSQYQ